MAADMEIICVGNELLIGKVVNTNASWLGKQATSMGIAVRRITVCADNVKEMAAVFREALARKPNFIVSTGGLGPTFDDKTLQGIAEALHRRLVVNADALNMVKEKYAEYAVTRHIKVSEMTEPRVKMATLPEGTVPLPNPVGTAPGVRADGPIARTRPCHASPGTRRAAGRAPRPAIVRAGTPECRAAAGRGTRRNHPRRRTPACGHREPPSF